MTEMRTTLAIAMSALLLAGGAAMVPVLAAPGPAQEDPGAAPIEPGQRLMGVVAVTDAELTADVEERSYGIAIANATGDPNRLAGLVAERVANASARLDAIESRLDALTAALESGEISEGRYRAEVAPLEVQRRSLRRSLGLSANATEGLPADLLSMHGIDASAIETLRERARDLDGRNVSQIARSIAGSHAGEPPGGRPNLSAIVANRVATTVDRVASVDDVNQAILEAGRLVDRAERQVERVERLIQRRPAPEEAHDLVQSARESLQEANRTFADARSALAAGDRSSAHELAVQAAQAAGDAIVTAEEAMEALRGPPEEPPGGGPPDGR